MKRNLSIKFHPEGSSSESVEFSQNFWTPSDVAPAKTYQGGTGLIYGSLTANKNDLYVLATPNSKIPQDLANTNNCLTNLNNSKTTPAVITTTINPLVSPH